MSSKELKKQQKLWYDILKQDGFYDIESPEGSSYPLKGRAYPRAMETLNEVQVNAISDYYSMCRQFLNEFKFEDKTEELVWQEFSEGKSIREISRYLLKTHKIVKQKSTVMLIVQKLEKLMKQKYMGPNE